MNSGPVPPPPPPPVQTEQKTFRAKTPLPVERLEPGDILIEGANMGGHHALMWVGGPKPVTHSASDHYFGVMQQGTGYFTKKDFSPDEYRIGTAVFRYRASQLSKMAAEFAVLWATPSDSAQLPTDRAQYRNTGIVMRTPYSKKRQAESHGRAAAWQPANQTQTLEALFRVLKAIARAENKEALSPNHGVACAQFVVYCYQAAALKRLLPGGRIPDSLLAAIKEKSPREGKNEKARFGNWKVANGSDENAAFWRDKAWWVEQGVFSSAKQMATNQDAASLLGMTLRHDGASDLFTSSMPRGMNMDVRAYNIAQLQKTLTSGESAFNWIGSLYRLPLDHPGNELDDGYRCIRDAKR